MEKLGKGKSPNMLLFFIVLFIFNLAASFAHPVTPTLIQTLNLHDYMFGLALGSMLFVNFMFAPFWGKISDYIGSRTTLLICSLGYALGQLFFGLARTELQFVCARMFAGIFTGGTFVCFMTYIANCSPEDKKGRDLAISVTLQNVGSAFGYFIGGMVGELGAHCAVWLQVATLAASGILFMLVMKDDAIEPLGNLNGHIIKTQCNPFSAFWQCRKFMTKAMIVLFIFYGLTNLGYNAFDQSFNYYLRDQFGLTSGYNGIIKAALGVISIAANSTICMWILKKKNSTAYLVGVTAICTVSMLGVILARELIPFIVVNILFFAFYFVSMPVTQDKVVKMGRGRDSNLVMGAFNSVKSFGGIFGALFAGFAYEINPRLPFILGFLGFALALLFTMQFYKIEKRSES